MGTYYEIASTGAEFSSVNSTHIVEVSEGADMPTTLIANTTYVIRGEVTITSTNEITVDADGCSIIGYDRNKDKLIYTGIGTLLTVGVLNTTYVNFTLRNLQLQAPSGKLLDAVQLDDTASAPLWGRTKVLVIDSCEIRNTQDIWTIQGFELVDLNNILIWYISGTIGCQFQDVRHLEISSCEFFNWYEESVPSNYFTASMIELELGSPVFPGFAVVNMSGNIIHPLQTQNGLNIKNGTTTSYGTISANTFIDVDNNPPGFTGELFIADGVSPSGGAYSTDEARQYDIAVNQGIPNSNAYILVTIEGNTTAAGDTDLNVGTPAPIEEFNLSSVKNDQRFSMTVGTIGASVNNTPIVSYTGTKDIFVSMFVTLSYNRQGGGGGDDFAFSIYKSDDGGVSWTEEPGSSITVFDITSSEEGAVTIAYSAKCSYDNVGGFADQFAVFCENVTTSNDILIQGMQWVIKE